MNRYSYCTNGVTQLIYKEFTAPPYSCDGTGGTQVVTHSTMNNHEHTVITWGMWDAGLLCRVIIQADGSLNGKLKLKIVSTGGELISYFMQPTLLPPDHVPRGFQENGLVEVNVQPGSENFIPADWRYFLFYSHNIVGRAYPVSGTLHLESWVEEWTDEDTDVLQSGIYSPTNNEHFTSDQEQELEEEVLALVEEQRQEAENSG